VKAEEFTSRITEIIQQAPEQRHRGFSALHDHILDEYLEAVQDMTEEHANCPSSDGRTIAQVVAHIAEWDRYLILAAGEMLAGVEWPQMMKLEGYLESDGRLLSFKNIDAFNQHQVKKYTDVPWNQIQELAVRSALTLHSLMTHPLLLNARILELGRPYDWRLPDGQVIPIPIGWYLWQINLEHEGVDHALDLGIG
jgi:hypothetical protein